MNSENQENTNTGTVSAFEFEGKSKLDWPDELLKPGQSELICREVNQAEAEKVQEAMEQAGVYPPGDAANRLRRHRKAYVGEIAGTGKIATYGWIAFDKEPLGGSGWAFLPQPGEAYFYDFATLPQYRGRGYYPILLRFILEELAKQQVKRGWIGTAPGNDVSARSIARAGFTLVGRIQVKLDESGQPHFEATPVPGSRPELIEAMQKAHVAADPV